MNKGEKTLVDVCPEIYNYWDWENNSRKPEDVLAYEKKKINLYCKTHNMRYQRSPKVITLRKCKCYCKECLRENANIRRVKEGKSCLLMDRISNIREYWVDEINDCKLDYLTTNSKKTITLYCKKHDFYFDKKPASLNADMELCPICAGKLFPISILYPELEKEYSEINAFPFSQITAQSEMMAIWKCSVPGCNCEWVGSVTNRIRGHSRCPNEKNH